MSDVSKGVRNEKSYECLVYSGRGLKVDRFFAPKNGDIYGTKEWQKGDVVLGDFQQKGVEFPSDWSMLARQMTASKYFYGDLKRHGERESSLKQLLDRVSQTMAEWGTRQGYFRDEPSAQRFQREIAKLTLDQRMAFNSPVWFNVGVNRYVQGRKNEQRSSFVINKEGVAVPIPLGKEYEHPQTAACFIQGVLDTMEDIMQLTTYEAMLFKYGSGTGTDLSTLRSSREKLAGGGKPSGPGAYLKFMSDVAGIVRSGGKTRRAAKMDSLRTDHPDIKEFIVCKKEEKKKAEALVAMGYSPQDAIDTVAFQNANLSVRASDEFMRAVIEDKEWQTIPVHNKELADQMPKYKARDLMRLISEGTYACGDPGMQFHTTINNWHTCPNSGSINASNPCSEYMFVDNSACNLASLNLLRFKNEDGSFDRKSFGLAAKLTAIAQDLEIDNSSYPRQSIAENAHKFRPLGQGYANLGALLMSWGLPYDSDEGRAVAAVITAYQTGKVYEASIDMAKNLGTFKEFKKNKKSMLRVIGMHRDALNQIDRTKIPKNLGLGEMLDDSIVTWDKNKKDGARYGFRNAQATVLAPTGTIGFLMDCDTTGIEPDLGLVKTKKLFDGGKIRIVNQSVEPALRKLGYDEKQISNMEHYIAGYGENAENIPHLKKEHREILFKTEEKEAQLKKLKYTAQQIKEIVSFTYGHGTVEGAPGIIEEHLPVFDCSNKSGDGKRFISPAGHIKMMAAVQPFLSGAISKTVNMPQETSVKEIEKTYIDAWKMGLKSVAIYRDESHILQPLTTSKTGLEGKVEDMHNPVRKKLPNERPSVTHKFNIAGHEGYLIVGIYPGTNAPGETFITMSKEGSTIGGLMDTIGTLVSMSLQYGVPLEALVKKFKGQKFDPRGIVWEGHFDIKTADSIVDYVFRYLGKKFLPESDKEKEKESGTITNGDGPQLSVGEMDAVQKFDWDSIPIEERGGFCPTCGKTMWRKGSCTEICRCGHKNTNGCGE